MGKETREMERIIDEIEKGDEKLSIKPNDFIYAREKNMAIDILISLIKRNYDSSVVEILKKIFNEEDFLEKMNKEILKEYNESDSGLNTYVLEEIIIDRLEKNRDNSMEEGDRELVSRLADLKRSYKLNDDEVKVLEFFYYIEVSDTFSDIYAGRSGSPEMNKIVKLLKYAPAGLNIKRHKLKKIIKESIIIKTEMLEKSYGVKELEASDWLIDCLGGLYEEGLTSEMFKTLPSTEYFNIGDFSVSDNDNEILKDLLKREGKCNILIYGSPGSGKTSYANALGAELKRKLLNVKVDEGDRKQVARVRFLHGSMTVAENQNAMVLVDEADELLNTSKSFFHDSSVDKSWLNSLMDSHNNKIIWIANRTTEIDKSTMRRFDYVLEFKKPSKELKVKVFNNLVEKYNLSNVLTKRNIEMLSSKYDVDSGGIEKSLRFIKNDKGLSKKEAVGKVEKILTNHELAIHGKAKKKVVKDFKEYSLDCLNTSVEPEKIINLIRRFEKSKMTKASILLSGMPGTGKTEFVEYIGHLLEKEICLKKGSDIKSKWVGGTEANIANAFEEAMDKEKILFFDEADSFFHPREDASHSWEKGETNEMLAQLNEYNGIVFFATNFMDGLDPAAMRRFNIKAEFKPLNIDGRLTLFNKFFGDMFKVNDEELRTKLSSLNNLTHGDYSVVSDNVKFLGVDENIDNIVKMLKEEVSYKENNKTIRGFAN